ncbi:leucyl aminopeptidase [Dehalococcoides mccartyi]|uniref:leucyl aminopeptidase n=1 Tax=Dehalococcoides mccartyi TaxID=61435 RepID=UPI00398A83DD
MEIKIVKQRPQSITADVLAMPVFEGQDLSLEFKELDSKLGGSLVEMKEKAELKGKAGELHLLNTLGKLPVRYLAVFGMGKTEKFGPDELRKSVGELSRALSKQSFKTIAIWLGELTLGTDVLAEIAAGGAMMGSYRFRKYFTSGNENGVIDEIKLVLGEKADLAKASQGLIKGQIVADAVCSARDLINEPSSNMTPTDLADFARRLAESTGLACEIFNETQLLEKGMGGVLGVGQGSCQAPKFIVLKYTGRDSDELDMAYIGKAITFDSGGISLKPWDKMWEMKSDMSGGAAVITAMGAIAKLKPAVNIMGIVPATENMPSGCAIKPGDILRMASGKTVEIHSTDAEGRLILADALDYACKQGAKQMVDVATLTGACSRIFGSACSGGFTNDDEFYAKVVSAAKQAGECIWQLPTFDEYKEMIKSDVADIKNVGGPVAGASTAALFLEEFVGNRPWVHLDIAGTAYLDKDNGHQVKGGSGASVATLISLALNIAK